ncbi:flagellar biosynthesis regulator FlhF [Paenibacillus physcomitrellae]|uniref:Flagellar biosynthesis protein FlhF n=2 Tax=Paenibacillus physcomitrellae TaxID=1619311 RepID=A0ABQ1G9W7_9BACL|nr:flagellar biosynthesis regulator FlhF [Paenibacillus physcomitrellae]
MREAITKEASHPNEDLFKSLLLNDIQQMKTMMNKLAREHSDERILPEPLEGILNRLKAQEIDPELAESWIKPAYEAWEASGESLGELELKQKVRGEIGRFLETRLSEGIADTARMVYVAGPTGVGKTTTIAKMAADQIFRKQKKVGFITADTYRISAVEQLRTYASILNVPLEIVQSPGDMKRAAARLEHCDLIFMDTAGRNYLNELYVAELHSLLAVKEQSETCLVLSLTSKSKDMKTIAEHFSKYGLDKVIFTKLDETESCGGLFNLLSEYPLKLLFLTNGQNVPDDLVSADQELLLNMLLGDESV